jgi:hypothetical protein
MSMHGQRCRALLAFAGLAAALALPSCQRRAKSEAKAKVGETPVLGQVAVKPIPGLELGGRRLTLDAGQLAMRVRDLLDHAAVFARPDGRPAAVDVSLEIIPFAEGGGDATEIGVKLRLRMAIRPEGAAPARFAEDVAAVGQAPLAMADAEAAQAALQRLAERTTGDLLAAYLARQKLWTGEGKDVVVALTSSDMDLRLEALRVIGARQLRDQVPAVMKLLNDADEGLRDAALGTLVALRERAAVKVLATSTQMRDAREMRKILDAIATLGGPEAADYLAFVAETHDDEEIRGMAKTALERLTRGSGGRRPTK